jgi:hypothetical protein
MAKKSIYSTRRERQLARLASSAPARKKEARRQAFRGYCRKKRRAQAAEVV